MQVVLPVSKPRFPFWKNPGTIDVMDLYPVERKLKQSRLFQRSARMKIEFLREYIDLCNDLSFGASAQRQHIDHL